MAEGGDNMAFKSYYNLYYKGQLMGTFSSYRDAVDDRERLIRLWRFNREKVDVGDFEIRSEYK